MRRSGLKIMGELIKLLSPLKWVMLSAIFTGVLGFLAATFLSILGTYGLLGVLGYSVPFTRSTIIKLLLVLGFSRGVLRYLEQYANHFVAFKLLAIIRDKVFKALRRLAPAKLEGRDKGNLITIITGDIELLEVFYAHTISPIAIALVYSIIMIGYLTSFHPLYGLVGLLAYSTVGIILPIINSKIGGKEGVRYRNKLGSLTSYLLESLRGLDQVIQFEQGEKRLDKLAEDTEELYQIQGELSKRQSFTTIVSDISIYAFALLSLFIGLFLYSKGRVDTIGVIIPFVTIIGSFGPTIALANLSNNLFHTFAAGERVLNLLEEEEVTKDIVDGEDIGFEELKIEDLSFAYEDEQILEDISFSLNKGEILGISGKSGSGKSTLLKLIMRFWSRDKGELDLNNIDIEKINTRSLRENQAYLTQTTYLFNDTIKNNIKVAKLDASDREVIEACKKASIHDFIQSLPEGYETRIGELGGKLSGGERQRLGLARAFLHESNLLLLDEPTSNLDSLNEAIVLKSLVEEDKTIILVSHRESSLGIADRVYTLETGRLS